MLVSCFKIKGCFLDVGGAFGSHAGRIARLTRAHPFVVDASQYAVDNCVPDVRGSIEQLDIGETELRFLDGYFDFVMCIETLEHVYSSEVQFALTEIARVMKPGAYLYASIDVRPERDGTRDFIDKSHQTMRPENWWRERLGDVGLVRDRPRENAIKCFKVRRSIFCRHKRLAPHMNWTVFVYRKPPG